MKFSEAFESKKDFYMFFLGLFSIIISTILVLFWLVENYDMDRQTLALAIFPLTMVLTGIFLFAEHIIQEIEKKRGGD